MNDSHDGAQGAEEIPGERRKVVPGGLRSTRYTTTTCRATCVCLSFFFFFLSIER